VVVAAEDVVLNDDRIGVAVVRQVQARDVVLDDVVDEARARDAGQQDDARARVD
jgi:hypothetical protein